ncbi:hypothetical protein [Streptomyces peucetius]|uniref:DUF4367 domain-containing protein n=1 Tax=Streptomyces peucetius TaxID=1950 RepID=A0ABY6IDN9_STRPE|nr:hypothetical protein [Streptomyces peucetius]UYQ63962.1 hypothetical protein OGH68_22505 [Streptomyces peucetius]
MADGDGGREERSAAAGAEDGRRHKEPTEESAEESAKESPEESAQGLAEELRRLGRGVRIPDVDGETMAERVLAQLLAESAAPAPPPVRRRGPLRGPGRLRGGRGPLRGGRGPRGLFPRRVVRWLRRRWRAVSVGLSGVLVVMVLTPPVRAGVAEWFGFGGVEVRHDPTAPPRAASAVPWCTDPVAPAEAGRLAGFTPRVPGTLGDPDAVSVTVGSQGRSVVSLCWRENGRTVRLDEFPARLDLGFAKQARLMPRWVPLADDGTETGAGTESRTGLWFEEPHRLRFGMTDVRGEGWVRAERTAGPTLLWTSGDGNTTLRLEGVASVQRAKEIAESAR